MRTIRKAALVAAFLCLPVPSSLAQSPAPDSDPNPDRLANATPCGNRTEIIERLRHLHGEVAVAAGLIGQRGAIEVFAAPVGSFTILFSTTNGRSCLVAAGDRWRWTRALPATPGL